MQGAKGGVIKLLKDDNGSHIVGIHCSAHRLELAFKAMHKSVPLLQTVETLLISLYQFYKNSAIRRATLAEAFSALKISNIVPTRVGGTRWLPHTKRALDSLWKGYKAIVKHLKQICLDKKMSGHGEAKGMVRLLQQRNVVVFMHFLTDVVVVLGKVSLSMQSFKATLAEVELVIKTSITTLESYKSTPGPCLAEVLSNTNTFRGFALTEAPTRQGGDAEDAQKALLKGLIDVLSNKFSDISSGLLGTSKLTNFKNWPMQNSIEYGCVSIAAVVRHYRPVLERGNVSHSSVLPDWQLLKSFVYETRGIVFPAEEYCVCRVCGAELFPNALAVVSLLLTLPPHSADCERGFSVLKKVKNDWRATDFGVVSLMCLNVI